MEDKIKETLEKQLQLLSERSQNAIDGNELAAISDAMVNVAKALAQYTGNSRVRFAPTYSGDNGGIVTCCGENARAN